MSSGFRKVPVSKFPFFRLIDRVLTQPVASFVEYLAIYILSANRRNPGITSVNTSDWNMIQTDSKRLCPLTLPFGPTVRAHARNPQRFIPPRMEHKDLDTELVSVLLAPHDHRFPHLLAFQPANPLANRDRDKVGSGAEGTHGNGGTINLKRALILRRKDANHHPSASWKYAPGQNTEGPTRCHAEPMTRDLHSRSTRLRELRPRGARLRNARLND
jgi:hypothetical protein